MSKHKVTSSFGFKEFDGTQEESEYWNKSRDDEKSSLKKKHVDTGECLLCMIDELAPQRVHKEVIEKPVPIKLEQEPVARKIVGGIIPRSHEKVEVATQNLKVSWTWYSEAQGLVAWTFENIAQTQASCILLRNSYYFGNAFWMVYENNQSFGTVFASKLEPLVDNTIQKNSPPLGIVSWKEPDGSEKRIVAFVFTLAPGQTWQMLEGGFSPSTPPSEPSAYEVTFVSEGDYCVGYDRQQVAIWDKQTGSKLQGYSPNPGTFHSVQVLAPPEAQFIQLFNDTILPGKCESVVQSAAEDEVNKTDASSAGEQKSDSRFWSLLAKNAGSLKN